MTSIEPHVRDEHPPDDAVFIVRGGPLTVERIVEHAARQAREYSLLGQPMISVSADLTVGGWTVEAILRERLWSRSRYATVPVGVLRSAGYLLLPTFAVPHYDIVLEEASEAAARRLLAHFGPVLDNPYKRRR
ncbi:MAG: hypothetical protein HYR51_16595 [Candidatus Rokubacteria bacterium]|nr:hypothetical protein [Candidatus Rokubacteria bacterium]